MTLSYDEIAEILKIIDGSSCDELIVETGDIKLLVRRHGTGGAIAAAPSSLSSANTAPGRAVSPAPAAGTSPQQTAEAVVVKSPHQIEVTAPMVGTFYRAPSPDAEPFVEIGSIVRKGDPLCLIEVMKLFTTIAAERDGRIAEIGAENTELVEYGRTLFLIDPV